MKVTNSILGYAFLLVVGTLSLQANANNKIKIKAAVDTNPAPHIFETTIVAKQKKIKLASGEMVTVFAYNGQIPGPEIRVKQGDRVIVHLKNKLPEGYPTTIHWHGIELNNKSDGTLVTQDAVNPGETYTYDFIVPRAGVFWYHPHARGAQEVAAGLYAPFIVTQPEERILQRENILPSRDLSLVLSDLSVVDGELKDIEATAMLETMNGTEGEILLVNGKELPTISVRQGQALRLRLINASISRYYRLSLPDHNIYRVGGEGGLIEKVRLEGGMLMGMRMAMSDDYQGDIGMIQIDQGYSKGEILLAPAQRADIIIIPKGDVGTKLTMQWKDFARGRHQMTMTDMGMMMTEADDDGSRASIDLFTIEIKKAKGKHRSKGKHAVEFSINEGDSLVASPEALVATRTDSQIKLQADMEAMMMGAAKNTWFKIDGFSGITDRTNYRTAALGEVMAWETHNHTDMHHPFHLHGFSFQATSFVTMNHDEGYMDMWTINASNEYVDTINVPPHTSVFYNFKVDERADYGTDVGTTTGDGALGDWVFHCHIFQHGENGMMSFLRIE